MASGKVAPRKVEGQEHHKLVMQQRRQGLSWREIGEANGYTMQRACRVGQRAFQQLVNDANSATEEVRKVEVERLDGMLQALWPKAEDGDEKTVDRVLKLMERRAKLLGLDAPQGHDLTSSDGSVSAPTRVELVAPDLGQESQEEG